MKGKPGRAKMPEHRKVKRVLISLSPLAYQKYQKIPKNERSGRISRFLERLKPELEYREPGKRLAGNENHVTEAPDERSADECNPNEQKTK